MDSIAPPLAVDFDGNPTDDWNDVVAEGLDDDRHLQRVPDLVKILRSEASLPSYRFQACFALAEWAEEAGYEAIQLAAEDPLNVPWFGILIDRFYSTDNTFGHLSDAISASDWIVERKGTGDARMKACEALLGVADQVNFDGRLDALFDVRSVDEVGAVVRRGTRRMAEGFRPPFDLPTQLMDLAVSLISRNESMAIELATDLISLVSFPKLLVHALPIVTAGRTDSSSQFGEYLNMVSESDVRAQVTAAFELRERRRS